MTNELNKDGFINDLFNFAKNYTNKYVVAIIEHKDEIAANPMLVDMLHELNIRETKELERFEKEFIWTCKDYDQGFDSKLNESYFDTYRHDCLVNAKSYRDVVRDYIWRIIEA